jgi:hypothetical protein
LGGQILTLNGFVNPYSQVKWIFSTKMAQHKALILFTLNSHAKTAPDTVLKQDRREIFHAAAEAQRMADYILGFHPDYSETPGESSEAEDEGAPSIGSLLAA